VQAARIAECETAMHKRGRAQRAPVFRGREVAAIVGTAFAPLFYQWRRNLLDRLGSIVGLVQ
jgi:hypothetical protein